MRAYLSSLVGNTALRTRLGDELARGALSHAYIIEGPSGSGKHTLARAIAMALACEKKEQTTTPFPCMQCPSCRKILAGNCPDLLTVSREEDKATMGIDVIRALREDVPTLPNELDVKVYVIEDAHTITTQAQNALLLTLEEPPPFVLFLLLCEESEALLETIRSRAPVLRMQPLGDAEMRTYLLQDAAPATVRAASALNTQSPTEFDALVRLSQGRIGRALELLEEKKRAPLMAYRADAERICRLLAEHSDGTELLGLLLSFSQGREEATTRLLTLTQALRDLLCLCHSDTAPLVFFADREDAIELSTRFTAATLLSFVSATEQTLTALAANANLRLALTRYFCLLRA